MKNSILKEVTDVSSTVLEETYNTGIIGINAGMTLTSVLAWHQTAQLIIKKYVPTVNATEFNLLYACMVTILTTLVYMLTQKYLKPSIKKTEIMPVISYKA